MSLIAEAAAHAGDAGIDLSVFVDILSKAGGAGAALERVRPYVLSGDTAQMRFPL